MAKKKKGKLWAEFKEFINRGNAFMLAVGVVIGGAFSAIVNAFVGMLTSLATWPVPGGLKGLVTVLPAVTEAQKGAAFLPSGATEAIHRQAFAMADANNMVIEFAAAQGKTITIDDADFIQWKNSLLSLYEQHGTTFTSKMSAIIDWGTLINAIISFLIIALVLFIIVKVVNAAAAKRAELEAARLEAYYQKHPEERPVPPEPGVPEPTEKDILNQILAELKKQNAPKAE
ncbi:MAG: MscL family protein [Bacilli bacterium]|nr:MscL family protein [Bacilli bacterium]